MSTWNSTFIWPPYSLHTCWLIILSCSWSESNRLVQLISTHLLYLCSRYFSLTQGMCISIGTLGSWQWPFTVIKDMVLCIHFIILQIMIVVEKIDKNHFIKCLESSSGEYVFCLDQPSLYSYFSRHVVFV